MNTSALTEAKKLVYSHMGKCSARKMTKAQRVERAVKAGKASAAKRKLKAKQKEV